MAESGSRRSRVRWAIWLSVGVVAGVLVGFAVGLARPRSQTPRIETP
jgi:hypothetical protein